MITQYRSDVIDRLRQVLPMVKTIDSYGGVFTREEVNRNIMNAPAIYVSALGTRTVEMANTGEAFDGLEMAAYVFTSHRGRETAEVVGWQIAQAVRNQMQGRHFTQGFGMATDLGIQNLWSGELDKTGATIMAVTWVVELVAGMDWLSEDMQEQGEDFVYPDFVVRVNGVSDD